MNPQEKRKGTRNDRKPRSQLKQELAQARDTLEKYKNELSSCQRELEQANVKLRTLAELQAELDSAEERLVRLRAVEQEKEKLKEQVRAAEENASSQLKEAKTKLQESEERRLKLEKTNQKHEKTIASLQEKLVAAERPEEPIPEDIPSSAASFRIDIYPRQGHYEGIIRHPLTKDKKTFTGLDEAAITELISRHLPQLEEGVKETEPVSVQSRLAPDRVEVPPSKEAPKPTEIPPQVPGLHELRISPGEADISSMVLRQDQPFEVRITLDLTDVVLSSEAPVEHTVTIYAKPLGGGPREIVGEAHGLLTSAEESTVRTFARALPAGTYRLEAAVTFSRPTGKAVPVPPGSFLTGSLFHVC